MRKIIQTIPAYGLTNGSTVRVALVDITGKPCFTSKGYSFDSTITVANSKLEFEILENDLIDRDTKYKVFYPSITQAFSIKHIDETIPHELGALFFCACDESVVDVKSGFVNPDFIAALDEMLSGGEELGDADQKVFELFAYYADHVLGDDGMTADSMALLDSAIGNYTVSEVE